MTGSTTAPSDGPTGTAQTVSSEEQGPACSLAPHERLDVPLLASSKPSGRHPGSAYRKAQKRLPGQTFAADLDPGRWYRRESDTITVCRVTSTPYQFSRNKIDFHDVEVYGQRSDGRVQITRRRADVPVRVLSLTEVVEVLDAQQRRTLRGGVLVPAELSDDGEAE